MIELRNVPAHYKVLELGGGDSPQNGVTCNVDVRPGPRVNFTQDFTDFPWKLADNEWDIVIVRFVLEHIPWRLIPRFLQEVIRIMKPAARVIFALPNTEAQLQWIKDHPEGWDGKGAFDSASCVLFGDQDYPENTHKAFFSPMVAFQLFKDAGFADIKITPYGERDTDMTVDCYKQNPMNPIRVAETIKGDMQKAEGMRSAVPPTLHGFPVVENPNIGGQMREAVLQEIPNAVQAEQETSETVDDLTRASLFDRHYFNGGGKVGGYAREGYWDYPTHEITTQHVLDRRPESVLEIGCARGYIIKRLQDRGIEAGGIEISKHCYMTRACDSIELHDICNREKPWPVDVNTGQQWDLLFSIATMEHIPEHCLPFVFGEMKRVAKRGLHGIDFGEKDDGFDRTHCTLKSKQWWREQFDKYGLQSHEIVDKEELERGPFPAKVLNGDGKVKLNVGCAWTCFHHGWTNIDIIDVSQFCAANGFRFQRHDVKQNGLSPWQTGTVDLIYAGHFLEHLSYREGLAFLRDCRRVLKQEGAMRLILPDARELCNLYVGQGGRETNSIAEFAEVNEGVANAKTDAERLYALLGEGHLSYYDTESVVRALQDSGFSRIAPSKFRQGHAQILAETLDTHPALSAFIDCAP